MNVWLLVLAGGSGTRFWPRSRAAMPKQLMPIAGEESLLVTTLKRFDSMVDPEHRVVLTTAFLASAVKKDVAAMASTKILAEPEARNTAPCIVMAMEWIRAQDKDAIVVLVPSDHWIADSAEYIRVMKHAVEAAKKNERLITVGIEPTRPETGFGYIRLGDKISEALYQVDRFVEKPSKEVAETMVQTHEYLWNAGMFVWSVKAFFSELEKYGKDYVDGLKKFRQNLAQDPKLAMAELPEEYSKLAATSIDYALMEKSKNVLVVPGSSFGWNDLGSFVALEEVFAQAEGGVGRAKRVMAVDSMANIVDAPQKVVALLGVTDLIVVDTGDVLMIASKERAQDVKKFVERLKSEGQKDLL